MIIGNCDTGQDVLVVAEIGNNHEGNFEIAKKLVKAAKASGAHAVKFQTFKTRYFISDSDPVRYKRLSLFELSYGQFKQLHDLAKGLGLLFLSTPLDLESAGFLADLVDAFKIASGDINFYPLLKQICQTGKPIIVSTGLSDLHQVIISKQFIEDQWRDCGISQNLAVLHCVSSYPVPPEQVNLLAIPSLARELHCTIGYSDHTIGIEAALIAVALGAQIIEKHFTLDKNYSDFRDHHLSADPEDMKKLTDSISRIKSMLGTGEKIIQNCEKSSLQSMRRSIVAGDKLVKGHVISLGDLNWIRPAIGIPPGEEVRILGKRLLRTVAYGEPILLSDLE